MEISILHYQRAAKRIFDRVYEENKSLKDSPSSLPYGTGVYIKVAYFDLKKWIEFVPGLNNKASDMSMQAVLKLYEREYKVMYRVPCKMNVQNGSDS